MIFEAMKKYVIYVAMVGVFALTAALIASDYIGCHIAAVAIIIAMYVSRRTFAPAWDLFAEINDNIIAWLERQFRREYN